MSSRRGAAQPSATPQSPPETPGLTPREFFTALFETVIAEAERNPAFAETLAHRLGQQVTFTAARPTGARTEPPAELLALDLKAARAELGETALREKLSGYRNAELAAFIRARTLSSGAVSRRPKNSLINAILRAAR